MLSHALCHLSHGMLWLLCAVYQWPPWLYNTALRSDVVCSFLCITDDVCTYLLLIHYVHHIMNCVSFITACLKHCHMSYEQHYVHPAREPLPALLQYSHFSYYSFIIAFIKLFSPLLGYVIINCFFGTTE